MISERTLYSASSLVLTQSQTLKWLSHCRWSGDMPVKNKDIYWLLPHYNKGNIALVISLVMGRSVYLFDAHFTGGPLSRNGGIFVD